MARTRSAPFHRRKRRALAPRALAVLAAFWMATVPLTPGTAQEPPDATLIADSIRADNAGRLVADGRVEMLFRDRRLQANRIVYDRAGDTIRITGPIVLQQGDSVLLLADEAELDSELRDGILRSARLVLDRQMQIAATEVQRVGGRYTQAYNTVASACEVCAGSEVPVWQIRAQKIIHDQDERQIYFEHARVEVFGLPVLYSPYLRLPDPTLERSAGFLVPTFRSNSTTGFGVTVPYFIPMGRRADLTVSPSITAQASNTVFATYRHAFSVGELQFDTGLTRDELVGGTRGFGRLVGRFDLPADFELTFDLEDVSDGGYYRDYGLPEADRIDSEIAATRISRDRLDEVRLVYFTSFRTTDNNDTLPRLLGTAETVRRFTPGSLGGTAELRFALQGHARKSDADIVGRDVGRASVDLDWRRNVTSDTGLVTTFSLGGAADYFAVGQDSTSPSTSTRIVPRAAVDLRFPMVRHGARSTQLLEPMAQLAWSGNDPRLVPNEDSVLTEFDEANLFDLNRFTGRDRIDQGWRAALGVRWTQAAASGWRLAGTLGRVYADSPNRDYAPSSGLDGELSDWLAAVRVDLPSGIYVAQRAQFQNDLNVNKAAVRLGWTTDDLNLASTYTWLKADPTVGRNFETSELALTSSYTFVEDWTAGLDWQYDLTADSTRTAGLGLRYQTECITVDLSLSRSFTASTTVQPTTNFGFVVSLDGVGNRPARTSRRKCRS